MAYKASSYCAAVTGLPLLVRCCSVTVRSWPGFCPYINVQLLRRVLWKEEQQEICKWSCWLVFTKAYWWLCSVISLTHLSGTLHYSMSSLVCEHCWTEILSLQNPLTSLALQQSPFSPCTGIAGVAFRCNSCPKNCASSLCLWEVFHLLLWVCNQPVGDSN